MPTCPHETLRCLSLTGWLITFVCTYVGFIFLIIGTMWAANIVSKVVLPNSTRLPPLPHSCPPPPLLLLILLVPCACTRS